MGNFEPLLAQRRGKGDHPPRQECEAAVQAHFLTYGKEGLHPHAYAQQRRALGDRVQDGFFQTARPHPGHEVAKGAHAGQHQAAAAAHHLRVVGAGDGGSRGF